MVALLESMYTVHVKSMTATEARRNWFRVLDEAVEGEVIVVERKGRRIIVRRDDSVADGAGSSRPDYRNLISVPDLEHADTWGWEWNGDNGELVSTAREPR
jgi:hypothetical protein